MKSTGGDSFPVAAALLSLSARAVFCCYNLFVVHVPGFETGVG